MVRYLPTITARTRRGWASSPRYAVVSSCNGGIIADYPWVPFFIATLRTNLVKCIAVAPGTVFDIVVLLPGGSLATRVSTGPPFKVFEQREDSWNGGRD